MSKKEKEEKVDIHVVPEGSMSPPAKSKKPVEKVTKEVVNKVDTAPEEPAKVESEDVPKESTAEVAEEGVKKSSDGPMILLLDDDELILHMYRKKLEGDGYTVKAASSGDEAIEIAQKSQPKVIFLDVVMAGKNGAEVLKELKQDVKTKDIPTIMLTNFSDKQPDIDSAIKAGALDYLIKSKTTPAQLSARIRTVLQTGK